jgi:hypothetical protein
LFPAWFSNTDRNAFEPAEYNAGFKSFRKMEIRARQFDFML